jgi:hypothetical protein
MALRNIEWGCGIDRPCLNDFTRWPRAARKASTRAIERSLREYPGAPIVGASCKCVPRPPSGWFLYRCVTIDAP